MRVGGKEAMRTPPDGGGWAVDAVAIVGSGSAYVV